MESIHLLRIVVASPGDVQAERDAPPAVIEELNRGIAATQNLRLELVRWETDAYPGFHPAGPQGLIDPILRIEDCDVLLGIFWKRFGTPTKEAGSGTEHEFLRAYAAWQQHGRPQIMVYFNQKAAIPKTKAETDQWGQVLEFQQRFPKDGLWWPYRGKAQFEKLVRNHPDANLRVLTAPVPEDDDASRRRREEEPQPQPWEHGALLPMRVVLREFVARGLPHTSQPATVGGDSLLRFIIAELPETLRPFESSLRQHLLRTGGLLLLDGLDEVPEADQRRVQVKTAVEQFAAAFPKVRVLVTSRTYAYQRQDWKLRGFAEAVLAPFNTAQMHRFVERWYAYVGQARRLSPDDTQGRAALLKQAITRTPRLYELATRPLLLTLMASLHAWRGGTLPEQREALYADAVDLLLDQWEGQKVRRLPDGTYDLIQPSLVEWLRVDQQAMRQALNRLAFEVHRDQPVLVGTADIADEKLMPTLLALAQSPDPDIRPARLIEHLRDRAGLLEPRGVGVYAFPHRTFQEYLAACYLTDADFT